MNGWAEKRHKLALKILRGERKDLRTNVLILFNKCFIILRDRHYCKHFTDTNLYNPNNPTREVLFAIQFTDKEGEAKVK